jgi:hypothetical protein
LSKVFMFITATMTVKQEKSMASLLASIRESGRSVEIVDHDELTRRLVLRAPIVELGFLLMIIRQYAVAAVLEVKASLRRKITEKNLRSIKARLARAGKVVLFYWVCGEGSVFGEIRGRHVLLKYCRKGGNVDPASAPFSLCSFDALSENIEKIVDNASKCFQEFNRVIGSANGNG